jgi:predicted branched-subunit amino acid permease
LEPINLSASQKLTRWILVALVFLFPWALGYAAGAIDNYDEGNRFGQALGITFVFLILPMEIFSPTRLGSVILTSLALAHLAYMVFNWRVGVSRRPALLSFLIVIPSSFAALLLLR